MRNTSMKYINCLFIFLALILTVSCNSGKQGAQKMTISGKFDAYPDKLINIIELYPDGNEPLDTVRTDKNGNFSKKIIADGPGIILIKLDNRNYITLITTPGEKITITAEKERFGSNYKVEGSEGSLLIRDYEHQVNLNLQKVDSLKQKFGYQQTNLRMNTSNEELAKAYGSILNNQKTITTALVKNNSSSLAAIFLLNKRFDQNRIFDDVQDFSLYEMVDTILFAKYPQNRWVTDLHERVLRSRGIIEKEKKSGQRLSPGMPAPDFTLLSTEGKEISLSSFSGKVTILHFWSSTDSRCRLENSKLVETYKKYHSQGLTIISVSLDSYKDSWLSAIETDRLEWSNVSDLSGYSSPVVIQYRIQKELPYYFLIDKNMKIADKGSIISDIEKKIPGLL